MPVTCSGGECLPSSPLTNQDFTLKTTAAIGDPANGGVVACTAGSAFNLNLIAARDDNAVSIEWSQLGTPTGATSDTDGFTNTGLIVTNVGANTGIPYAAQTCQNFVTGGGYTSGWFLPAKDQLNCLNVNKTAIGNFALLFYWSSTEFIPSPAVNAWYQAFFLTDAQNQSSKNNNTSINARCVRAYT